MPLLQQAWLGLKNNQRILFAFLLLSAAISLLFSSINIAVQGLIPEDESGIPTFVAGLKILLDLIHAAVRALFYAVFFALLGEALYKPLWKYGAPREAVKRFFMPWFLLVLVSITLVRMQEGIVRSEGSVDMLVGIEMIVMLLYLVGIPIAAAIMFLGRFEWGLLQEALQPYRELRSLTMLVLLVNFGQYLFLQILLALTPEEAFHSPFTFAVMDMPLSLLDALAFVMCWEIMKRYQTLELEEED